MSQWEPVIGLEIHLQLNTKTKLFSHAPNQFGAEPNTHITDVCTGLPGTLPVLNAEAVKKALQLGYALNSHIARESRFDRKSYFYPDSPRNYQITQFSHPILRGGFVEADVCGEKKIFPLDRAHLEDDAGMLRHFSSFAGIDYNRAGSALIEIVSTPCMHSPQEASAYAMAVHSLIRYLDISDGNMEEGSFRMDVNISVRHIGEQTLRGKIEVKNMNSFHYLELAIAAEVERQISFYMKHPMEKMPSATFRFDPVEKKAVPMREKEGAEDYRFFPEPDLPPLFLSEEYIQEIALTIPELPSQRKERYATMGIAKEAIETLVQEKSLSDYFDSALPYCKFPKTLSNWILVEWVGRWKERHVSPIESGIEAAHVAELVNFVEERIVTGKIAKEMADAMCLAPGTSPAKLLQNNPDYTPLSNSQAILQMVQTVIAQNPQSIEDWKKGKTRAFDFLVGQVMKLCKGTADPETVRTYLREQIP